MQPKHPLVTILINNYNYGRYLKEAIESAIKQNYSHTEIILVDDGSSDHSQEIILNYKNQLNPIFKDNGGQASAFNWGFSIAKGDILCILDADDIWLPNKVEEVVKAYQHHSQVAVIYHKVQNINQYGNLIGRTWPPYPVIQGNIIKQVKKTGGWWPFPPSTALSFTRTFLEQVMNIPEKLYRICADTYLADLAPFFGDVIGIDQPLSFFRLHNANNWSHNINYHQRFLQSYELRNQVLNQVLQTYGQLEKIDLSFHLPYQKLKLQSGVTSNIFMLSKLALENPWEPRLTSRLKTMIELGKDFINI